MERSKLKVFQLVPFERKGDYLVLRFRNGIEVGIKFDDYDPRGRAGENRSVFCKVSAIRVADNTVTDLTERFRETETVASAEGLTDFLREVSEVERVEDIL